MSTNIAFGTQAGLNIHTAEPSRTFPEQCNIYNVISKFFNEYTQDPHPYVKLKKEFLNTESDWEHALNCAIGKINKTLNEKEKELTNKQSQLEEYVGSAWELQAKRKNGDAEIEVLKKEKAVLHVECLNLQKERDEWKSKCLLNTEELGKLNRASTDLTLTLKNNLTACVQERDEWKTQAINVKVRLQESEQIRKNLLEGTQAEIDKLNKENKAGDDLILQLNNKLAACESERDNYKRQLDTHIGCRETENNELKAQQEERAKMIISLSDDIVALSNKLAQSTHLFEMAKKQRDDLQEKCDEKNALLINATKQIEQQNELIKAIKIVAKEFL